MPSPMLWTVCAVSVKEAQKVQKWDVQTSIEACKDVGLNYSGTRRPIKYVHVRAGDNVSAKELLMKICYQKR